MKIRKISHRGTWSFHVVVVHGKEMYKDLQSTCTAIVLFINLLVGSVLVVVAVVVTVVVWLSSLTENSVEAAVTQTYLVMNIFAGFYWPCAREEYMLAM